MFFSKFASRNVIVLFCTGELGCKLNKLFMAACLLGCSLFWPFLSDAAIDNSIEGHSPMEG